MRDSRNNSLKVGDKIKIISCSGKDYWYKNYIGEIFKITGTTILTKNSYTVYYKKQYNWYCVFKKDIIKVGCLKNKIRKLKKLIKSKP